MHAKVGIHSDNGKKTLRDLGKLGVCKVQKYLIISYNYFKLLSLKYVLMGPMGSIPIPSLGRLIWAAWITPAVV